VHSRALAHSKESVVSPVWLTLYAAALCRVRRLGADPREAAECPLGVRRWPNSLPLPAARRVRL